MTVDELLSWEAVAKIVITFFCLCLIYFSARNL